MVEEQKAEAQQALEWLFSEHLLPFELSAHRVEPIGSEEYIVRFHDSRLRSVDISWHQGLPGGQEIVSIITKVSAESLGLSVGKEAYAVIKASEVMIATD